MQMDWGLLKQYWSAMAPWQWAIVLIAVSVGAWSIFQLRAWFREDTGRADDNLEMLTQFRDLHRQGDLSEDEYRLIKSRLVGTQLVPSGPGKTTATTPAKTAARGDLTDGISRKNGETNSESRTVQKPPTKDSVDQFTTGHDQTSNSELSGRSPDDTY